MPPSSSKPKPRRFSLLLLVVLGALALALVLSVTLLVPAIRAARDAARREQLRNEAEQVEKAVEAHQGND